MEALLVPELVVCEGGPHDQPSQNVHQQPENVAENGLSTSPPESAGGEEQCEFLEDALRGGGDGEEVEGDPQPHVPGDGSLADGGGCAGVEEGDEAEEPLKKGNGEKEKRHCEVERS